MMSQQEHSEFMQAASSSTPASASKAALAALGVLATGLSLGASAPAIAAQQTNEVRPVAFVAQQVQPTAGTDRLQQWENQLREQLGRDGIQMRRVSSGTGCTTCCPDADDCGSD